MVIWGGMPAVTRRVPFAIAVVADVSPAFAGLLARPRPGIGLAAEVLGLDGDTARVRVATRDLAVDVQVEAAGWTARDAHFHLPPGGRRAIELQRHRPGARLSGRVFATNALEDALLEASP